MPGSSAARRWRRYRLLAVLVLIAALWTAGRLSGLHEEVTPERVQRAVHDAGPWGVALFVAVFCAGVLVHVPGLVFVAAAMFLYDGIFAFALSLVGGVVAATASFMLVRLVGGRPLPHVERPLMRRLLAHLDARPISVVAALRLVFLMTPAVNYVLALSGVRLRDFVIGTTLGFVPVVAIAGLLFEWLFR